MILTDSKAKLDYIEYIYVMIFEDTTDIENVDIDQKKRDLYQKWGKYIPSYIAKKREEKILQIIDK